MSVAPLEGLPVTVMGLGLFGGGSAVARWLAARGARVTVTDLRDERVLAPALAELRGARVELVLGRHRDEDFTGAAMVVANPAVPPASPFLELARRAGVRVTSEIELFLAELRARAIAVTGTQGKSSTASFTAQLLAGTGRRAHLGGNIGRSLLDDLGAMQPDDVAVIELSSYQLEALAPPGSPHAPPRALDAAAIVNVLADHLERHGTREAYARAKLRILELARPGAIALLPAELAREGRARELRTVVVDAGTRERGLAIEDGRFWCEGEELGRLADLALPGAFQARNVLVALALARALGAEPARLARALGALRAPPHRLEPLGVRAGRAVIDNGVSTTPDSTLVALAEVRGDCTLVLGGKAKQGLSFDELALEIARRGARAVAFGAARDAVAAALQRAGAPVLVADDLAAAVRLALEHTPEGGTILFSPAAASFDAYANFRARAEHFRALLPAEDGAAIAARDAP